MADADTAGAKRIASQSGAAGGTRASRTRWACGVCRCLGGDGGRVARAQTRVALRIGAVRIGCTVLFST